MLRFDIITIFPAVFENYFKESILKRAQREGLVSINIHNLRDYTKDPHKTVDDKPFGGGPGMVLMVEPIFGAVTALKKLKSKKGKGKTKTRKSKIILFSVRGRKFDQKTARYLSKLDQLIMICGRYEGVDERVAEHVVDTELSIGDYVLTGGELPAMVVVDALTRLVPGVIKDESIIEENRGEVRRAGTVPVKRGQSPLGSYPVYTRPEIFCPKRGVHWRVPDVLLSGNHAKIKEWRKEAALFKKPHT